MKLKNSQKHHPVLCDMLYDDAKSSVLGVWAAELVVFRAPQRWSTGNVQEVTHGWDKMYEKLKYPEIQKHRYIFRYIIMAFIFNWLIVEKIYCLQAWNSYVYIVTFDYRMIGICITSPAKFQDSPKYLYSNI